MKNIIINIGDKVKLTNDDQFGVVTGILQEGGPIQYRVARWVDGNRMQDWLFDFEVRKVNINELV